MEIASPAAVDRGSSRSSDSVYLEAHHVRWILLMHVCFNTLLPAAVSIHALLLLNRTLCKVRDRLKIESSRQAGHNRLLCSSCSRLGSRLGAAVHQKHITTPSHSFLEPRCCEEVLEVMSPDRHKDAPGARTEVRKGPS